MAACCSPVEAFFDEKYARTELRRYRRGRLDRPTRRLLGSMREVPAFDSVLDIGGGVGILSHEILAGSSVSATLVDGASAHARAAREEAERQGHAGRLRVVHGDFLDVMHDIEPADVVLMHRVVCCYPDAPRLLAAAAGRAKRALVLSYPRDNWFNRAEIAVGNWIRARRPVPFRAFVHPQSLLDATLASAGLERQSRDNTFTWRIDSYLRPGEEGRRGGEGERE